MSREPSHTPVLRGEVVQLLSPAGRRLLVDCTIGLGGHAEALMQAAGQEALLIGLDVDEANLRLTRQRLSAFGDRVRLFCENFTELRSVLAETGAKAADAILADLGVASSQLTDAARGFSFAVEGPLDMRLDREQERTAGELVNTLGEKALAEVIYTYGEERYSRRIARAIVEARKDHRIATTTELAGIVTGAYPAAARKARRGVHPATRTFQALRIAVNNELNNLESLLEMLPDVLTVGGRAAVISFHSLEDRRVKQAFAKKAATDAAALLTKKPITPTAEEIAGNPRSRSAKLRGIERLP